MPELPQLALTSTCPDTDCRAHIGQRHSRECTTATCLHNGQQRALHLDEQHEHDCGRQVWTGLPAGTVEAAAHGLWVRPAGADDAPATGWIPCEPQTPGAVPDLDRVMRSGQWNRARQRFDLPAEMGGSGNV